MGRTYDERRVLLMVSRLVMTTALGGTVEPSNDSRERDAERRADVLLALDGDLAAVRLDDRAADRKPEARTRDRLLRRVGRSEEALEQMLLLLLRHAGARVHNLDHDRAVVLRRSQLHPATAWGEFQRIRDEVVEQLGDPHLVAAHDDWLCCAADECHAACLRSRQRSNEAFATQLADVERRTLDLELASVVARDEEQVTDEPLEPARVAGNDLEILLLHVGDLAAVGLEEELDVPDDRRQRR